MLERMVMPPAEPTRLTDNLWLAAHDSVNGKPWIGDWPLGVGLAAGLLAELIHAGSLELRRGELFRTAAEPPGDPALRPLMIKMQSEEQDWPPNPPAFSPRGRASARPAAKDERAWHTQTQTPAWPMQPRENHGWPTPAPDDQEWPPDVYDGQDWHVLRGREESRHRQRGHPLGAWMSYLAYERRAEDRVIDRLSRTGLGRRRERRRLLGGTTVSYVPCDSVASGTAASGISIAVRSRRGLDESQLFLAGLFLATGLHHHALATLTSSERSELADELKRGLGEMPRELLRAADAAVGEAAMR